ncbi:hypothetical protein KFK09_027251 [Dendrobium nobile]|uniref:Uncharacterized protein n=1 Tax=Dendrobium nobile TaxID=94219 RepID=A0A8T3AFD2_DENNO|nr:hypothetical protein KFK09_027251 [Dendrobium nobile]
MKQEKGKRDRGGKRSPTFFTAIWISYPTGNSFGAKKDRRFSSRRLFRIAPRPARQLSGHQTTGGENDPYQAAADTRPRPLRWRMRIPRAQSAFFLLSILY